MRGLQNESDKKFDSFFTIVQREAAKAGAIFFVLCGEGNDCETDQMYMENLSGWLVPKDRADSFERKWKKDRHSDDLSQWDECFVWETWDVVDGRLIIEFEKIRN